MRHNFLKDSDLHSRKHVYKSNSYAYAQGDIHLLYSDIVQYQFAKGTKRPLLISANSFFCFSCRHPRLPGLGRALQPKPSRRGDLQGLFCMGMCASRENWEKHILRRRFTHIVEMNITPSNTKV